MKKGIFFLLAAITCSTVFAQKAIYKGKTMPVSFEYNSKWKLKDFTPKQMSRNTLSIDGGSKNGYIWITLDTSSLGLNEYFKKNIERSYLSFGEPYMPNFKQGTTIVNQLVTKFMESTDEKNDNFTAHYLISVGNNRFYLFFISVSLKYKEEALRSVFSFKA